MSRGPWEARGRAPFISPDVGRPSEPRVQDEDASKGFTPPDGPQKGRIVAETQPLSEPVDGVLAF